MEHTPGPWKAKAGSVKAISHGQWFTVAIVDKKRFTPEGRATNARLIAAAPQMLQAIQELIAEADDHPGWEGHKHSHSFGFELARAAIAKAEEEITCSP